MRSRVPEVVGLARGATLHLGCAGDPVTAGVAALHGPLLRAHPGVIGLDLSPPGLRAVRTRAGSGGGLVAGNALALPFADRTFDTVVAAEIIEHVGCPERLLDEARRVLRGGGRLIVTTPNPFCLQWLAMARRGAEARWDPGHVAWFDPRTLATLAARVGLRVRGVAWVRNARPSGTLPLRLAAYRAARPLLSRVLPPYVLGECFVQVFEVVDHPAADRAGVDAGPAARCGRRVRARDGAVV
ncbi:MAG: class I SAM-dependent methyltransferase [Acidobacteria bacterium]|nr:class I SAM-dependent methyltransferase [Acidobacteriota bacterium]